MKHKEQAKCNKNFRCLTQKSLDDITRLSGLYKITFYDYKRLNAHESLTDKNV